MAKRNPLDRLDDWVDKVWPNDVVHPRDVTQPVHRWWIVTNSTHTGMVITDEARCIVTAPVVWNRFIGMDLNVLLERVHASASRVPGPTGKPA